MSQIHNDLRIIRNQYGNLKAVPARVAQARATSGCDSDVPAFFNWLEESSATEETPEVALNSERVLLVDDEPVLRRHGALFLQALGYQVTVCADGFAAIDAFFRDWRCFDLLFTDVSMPGMDGRVLAERLQEVRPDLPVLFTSGFGKETLFSFPEEYERVRFLPKPYSPGELALALRQLLSENIAES